VRSIQLIGHGRIVGEPEVIQQPSQFVPLTARNGPKFVANRTLPNSAGLLGIGTSQHTAPASRGSLGGSRGKGSQPSRAAASSAGKSILIIRIIASMALGWLINSPILCGTICQHRPKRSVSQPQAMGLPPSINLSQ
jgi:hypothetical protein